MSWSILRCLLYMLGLDLAWQETMFQNTDKKNSINPPSIKVVGTVEIMEKIFWILTEGLQGSEARWLKKTAESE